MNETPTVDQCVIAYLSSVALSRSANTTRTYRNAMRTFSEVLLAHKLQPDKTLVTDLHEEPVVWMATALKPLAPSTEQCYLTAMVGFYEYIAGENLAPINLPRVRLPRHPPAAVPQSRH